MTIILNTASGATDKSADAQRLLEIYRSAGIEPTIRLVPEGAGMTEIAREVVRSGEQTVVAGGGDGTVRSVADALAGTGAVLAVLPLGTLNNFARHLNIPLELEAAARIVLTGRIAAVDVGEVNGHVFVNNSSLGLYPMIVRLRNLQRQRGRNRWIALLIACLQALWRYPTLHLRMEADDRVVVRTTPFVFVGNNEYEVESFGLGSRSCLDAGFLWLCAGPHRRGRWRFLSMLARALLGRLRPGRDFVALNVREVWVGIRRPHVSVALDGEVTTMDPPLHYRSRPGALRVIVPSEAT